MNWLVIGTVCFGAFMGQLDASIVTLAFPAIGERFGADAARVEWVSLAYLIALVALLAPVGRFADRVGRKRVYVGGFTVFTAASLACCLAPTLDALVVARVVQAAGAAMLQANSVALIVTNVAPEKMRAALGVQAGAQALGLAAGPLAGGFLVTSHGWASVFAINVPVGVAAIVAGHFLLPDAESRGARIELTPLRDPLVVAGLGGVLVAYAVLFAPMVVLPFTMRQPLTDVGLVVAVLPTGFAVAATLLTRASRRAGITLSIVAGLLLTSPVPAVVPLFLLGIGLGIVVPASSKAVMARIPACSAGLGSGLVNMARGMGTAAGVAVASLLVHSFQ
ncbi:MFS transporter [Lentzea tibetensis]|uniref:MFS transporter n=1 Tax=Lentzea tibetensis TaxID=2591470 RepID=A0A563EG09_9PSEU|nr:MFS transporter [Lentzea tibetensis]TWP44743.1 MFS transporter [Lentzea tibetensis]